MTKWAIICLSIALIGSNVFWVYAIVDNGVTITYMQSSMDYLQSQLEQTIVLSNMDLVGLSTQEALLRIGKDVDGFDPFIKEECIWAGQVCMQLENNYVSEIRLPSP